MGNHEFLILPEVKAFLAEFLSLLVSEGYKSSLEYADKMLDEVVDFIYQLPNVAHLSVDSRFSYHLS